jgi:hypothetical protein
MKVQEAIDEGDAREAVHSLIREVGPGCQQ